MLILEITEPAGATRRVEMSGDNPVVIGRTSDCTVMIEHRSVARHHAVIRATPGGWQMDDSGQGGGTLLNGRRVARTTPIKAGDVVTVGQAQLKVLRADQPA
jgi:pSer/pThr/pTyr-binding forkhead associated (FHA) protein